jgi:hypothetical protein
MDNLFSTDLFANQHKRDISGCAVVKLMGGGSFENEKLKLKWGDTCTGVSSNLMAVTSKDKQYVSMLTCA